MRPTLAALLALCVAIPVHVAGVGAAAAAPNPLSVGGAVPDATALPDLTVDPAEFADEAAALPEGLEEALARDVGITPEQYLAESELALRADQAVEALREQGIAVEGSRVEDDRVLIQVVDEASKLQVERQGVPAEIVESGLLQLGGVTFEPAADLHGGAPTYFSGYRCSAGFSGVSLPSGASQTLTAGHCLGDPSAERLLGSMRFPSDDSSFLVTSIGLPIASTYRTGDGWDFGRFAVTAADVTARPSVLTWDGGSGAPLADSPLPVRDAARVTTSGSTLCKSGSSSGWTCGPVIGLAIDLTVGSDGDSAPYLVDGILACVEVVQGDSGGPALLGTTAVGITSAVGVDASGENCGTAGAPIGVFAPLYSPTSAIASAQSLYGSSWEPSVAVARPTITSFSGSNPVYSGDVLSGTVPYGRTRHRVEVVIDGGAVRKANVAVDGTWSVDISDLAVGDHSYSVQARWGVRSASSRLTGTWTTFTASRIAGANRFDTAARISQRAFPAGARTVFIANGLSFPDALSAGPAAARLGGPVLLTAPQALPAEVATELRRLDPDRIIIVGGSSVVSTAVARALRSYGTVERWSGADRYATSREIARRAFSGGAEVAYLATGAGFPDALSAGAAGANVGAPVILVPGTQRSVDAATASLLRDLGVSEVRIAGGTGVVSSGIASTVKNVVPTVRRLSGADRYATSLAINANAVRAADEVYLTSGVNFPDALAGSVLAGLRGAPMYISASTCVDPRIVDHIAQINATRAVLLGGSSVLGSRVARLTTC